MNAYHEDDPKINLQVKNLGPFENSLSSRSSVSNRTGTVKQYVNTNLISNSNEITISSSQKSLCQQDQASQGNDNTKLKFKRKSKNNSINTAKRTKNY